jgi:hypothetical protein
VIKIGHARVNQHKRCYAPSGVHVNSFADADLSIHIAAKYSWASTSNQGYIYGVNLLNSVIKESRMGGVFDAMLWVHIVAGNIALVGGVVAIVTRKGARLHRRSGIVYVLCMIVVGVTALVMSTIRPNPFLFAVAIFSAAMALSG